MKNVLYKILIGYQSCSFHSLRVLSTYKIHLPEYPLIMIGQIINLVFNLGFIVTAVYLSSMDIPVDIYLAIAMPIYVITNIMLYTLPIPKQYYKDNNE